MAGSNHDRRLELLVDLASMPSRRADLEAELCSACHRIALAMGADRATMWLVDAERGELVTRVAVLPELPELRQPMSRGISGWVARTGQVVRVADAREDPRWDPSADRVTGYVTRSQLVVPIRDGAQSPVRGVLQVLNGVAEGFAAHDEQYLLAIAAQLGVALRNAPGSPKTGSQPDGAAAHVVGRSVAMAEVFRLIHLAAQTDATVLLRGETGTGKGLLARSIAAGSRRGGGPFVTVDCTTLPAPLAESELFGHEKGAYTGAERRVAGKVELARGGTLFLDEVGELSPELQAKFLRFMQDRAFERVGGRELLRADVRVVCATHRDLEGDVAEGRFREDLYYRIRVVEIRVPPLRERGAEEVECLAEHFMRRFADRYGRKGVQLTLAARKVLREHVWPGNVRELEHWMESAVVLSPLGEITPESLPKPANTQAVWSDGAEVPLGLSLREAQKRYALAMIRACGGNKSEAARRLGVGRNRLSRIVTGRD